MKDGAPRGRMDEADEIALVEAMLDRSERVLAGRRPYLAQDRLEPDAVFIDRSQLDARLWKGHCHVPQQGT